MRPICVCVPARNEADRIPILLDALARQTVPGRLRVMVCVNNSEDGTADIARAAAGAAMELRIEERLFPDYEAHAGSARRIAMDLAAGWLADDAGLLISTDADCRPPETWLAAIVAACDDNRIVGGRILLDDTEPVAPAIFEQRRRFDRYWQQVREIEDAEDPLAWDTAPRHGDHTGASLALTVGLYRRAGGVPAIATGEDRALVDAAIAAGGRLVHPVDVWTRASARTQGRAHGGMALDMARWSDVDRPDRALLVPALSHWHDRARWRRAIRLRHGDAAVVAAERDLPPMPNDMPLVDLA